MGLNAADIYYIAKAGDLVNGVGKAGKILVAVGTMIKAGAEVATLIGNSKTK